MVDPTSTSSLPYSYAALPGGNGPNGPGPAQVGGGTRGKPNKIGLVILSGLIMSTLLLSLFGYTNKGNKVNVGHNEETTEGGSVVSRGVAHGVSEKSNGLPLKGVRVSPFDWNDLQLSWHKTSFHFQPQKNWMNDPNGPLFYNGWYHLFYQYNPEGAIWGNIVWGHAISKDLIKWTHLPIAMKPDRWYDSNGVWTGSATILPDGRIMMLYTGSTNNSVQVQNLAWPDDLSDPFLLKWVKYAGNPVLVPPPGIGPKDFRDPTTAWLTSEGQWRITIGSKINKTGISLVYDTTDFKSFNLRKGILHGVAETGMWECVDFYPVSVSEPNGLDTSAKGPSVKHVLKASMDDDRHDYYALGSYDERNGSWVADDESLDVGIGLKYDYGEKLYASKTFYDEKNQRRILWGWIPESDSEDADIRKGWASVQAVPRTVLYDQKTGTNLVQWPVTEVETLRHSRKDFSHVEITPETVFPLDVGSATELDIVAEFDIDPKALETLPVSEEDYSCPKSRGAAQRGALGPFGFLVLANEKLSEQTPVYFYLVKTFDQGIKTFFCSDLSRSSKASDVEKDIYGSTVPVLKGEKLSMRILVDHSIVEGFAQGGRTCITSRVYPTKAIYRDAKLYLFNNATSASVTASVKTWQMRSARGQSQI